jgi:hypothetical protein
MDVDGSQVEALYRAGQLDAIRRYCLCDVIQTSFVFLRFRLLQGSLTLEEYQRAAKGLFHALEQDGRFNDLLSQSEQDHLLLSNCSSSKLVAQESESVFANRENPL